MKKYIQTKLKDFYELAIAGEKKIRNRFHTVRGLVEEEITIKTKVIRPRNLFFYSSDTSRLITSC